MVTSVPPNLACNMLISASESRGSHVHVGTLAATARALSDGSQPFDFAGWGTPATSRSAPLSSSEANPPDAPTDQRQHSRILQPLPKVPLDTLLDTVLCPGLVSMMYDRAQICISMQVT